MIGFIKRLASAACALALSASAVLSISAAEEDFTLTLVHTNDIHGHPEIYPYLKNYIAQVREEKENVLLIDSGDAIASTSFARYESGITITTLMNMCGYDLYTLGNNEQLLTSAEFGVAIETAEFVRLGGNAPEEFVTAGGIQDYVINEYHGTKVAFIGVTTSTSTEVDYLNSVKAEAEAEGATVFVLIAHRGVVEADTTLRSTYIAQSCPWIDVIIDGHCHTTHWDGFYEGDVLIAETGEYGNNVGVVELTISNGTVSSKSATVTPVSDLGVEPDAEVEAYIAEVTEALEYLQQVVATFNIALDGERATVRTKEAALGNIAADAMLYVSDAQIALVPSAFLRASIAEGGMTRQQLNELFLSPETVMTILPLTGAQLTTFFEYALSGLPETFSGFRQVGGIKVVYDSSAEPNNRLISITLADGTPLEDGETYNVICTDMDFEQIYTDFEETGMTYDALDITLNEAFLQYVNSGEVATWEVDGRLLDVSSATDEPGTDEVAAEDLAASAEVEQPASEEAAATEVEEPASEEAAASTEVEQPASETRAASSTLYTVEKGDSLWKIALRFYGDGSRWQEIYQANKDLISNPSRIYVGQVLMIP